MKKKTIGDCNVTQNFRKVRQEINWLYLLIFKTGKMPYPTIKDINSYDIFFQFYDIYCF